MSFKVVNWYLNQKFPKTKWRKWSFLLAFLLKTTSIAFIFYTYLVEKLLVLDLQKVCVLCCGKRWLGDVAQHQLLGFRWRCFFGLRGWRVGSRRWRFRSLLYIIVVIVEDYDLIGHRGGSHRHLSTECFCFQEMKRGRKMIKTTADSRLRISIILLKSIIKGRRKTIFCNLVVDAINYSLLI